MEQALTFEQLPTAVTKLTKEVSELKRLLIEKQEQAPTEHPDKLLTVQEAAEFLHLSTPTIYSKVSRSELPVCKTPGSKRLYFSLAELTDYVKSGRKLTNAEIEAKADQYLTSKNGRA